jgi:type I restriction enzyme, S subunit
MELNSGYKQTQAGLIPEEWGVSTIGEVAKTSSGTTPSRALAERYYRNGHISWVKTLDLNNSDITATEERVTEAALNEANLRCYPCGSVVVAMYGGFNQIGRTGLLRIPATVNQALTAIQPHPGRLSPAYLQDVLNFRVGYWKSVASSSRKDPNITSKDIRDFPIALPVLEEQEAIADALSDADALTGSLKQLVSRKREVKQGAIQELLTGKKRLPGFSKEWPSIGLGDLFTFKNGLNKAKGFFGHGTPIVNYMDVFQHPAISSSMLAGRVSLTNQELSTFDVRMGDVFFTRTSETADEVGIASVILDQPNQTVFSGFLLRARPKNNKLCNEFKKYCFAPDYVRKQIISRASYTTRALTNGRILSAVTLRVPESEEQLAIAEIFNDMDAEIDALEIKLKKARHLKQGMMQQLLTGKVRLV